MKIIYSKIKQLISEKMFISLAMLFFAQFITLTSGILVYKYLYNSVDSISFISWVAIYELSVLFTLGDVGFTHQYIKNNSIGSTRENFYKRKLDYFRMRGQLLIVSSAAFFLLLGYGIFFENNVDTYAKIFLSASIFISILGYSETAELRVRRNNEVIYSAIILANITFMALVVLTKPDIMTFAFLNLIRSIVLYLIQAAYVGFHWVAFSKPSPGLSLIFLINVIYIFQFAVDAKVLSLAWIGAELSFVLMTKKIIDGGKGFADSAISLLAVDMNGKNSNINKILFFVFVVFLFAAIFLAINIFGGLISSDYGISASEYWSLAVYYMASILLRYIILWMYWVDIFSIKIGLYVLSSVIAMKVISVYLATDPFSYYQIHALGILALLVIIYSSRERVHV